MSHEVFVSYNSKMKNVADKIVSTLEANNIKCWYAPRDVIGDYATAICNGVEGAKIFVLLLDTDGSKKMHVLNEVELAYKRIVEHDADLTILPFKLDKEELSKAMQYYVQRMHWIDASNDNLEDAVNELLSKVKIILEPYVSPTPKKRIANTMYEITSEKELKRLEIQTKFLHEYDGDLYKNVLLEQNDAAILDIGTNDGKYIIETLNSSGDYSCLLGLDFNKDSIQKAKNHYQSEKNVFQYCNVEKDDIENVLANFLNKRKLSGFDIINISMVLLHLSNPELLLKKIRKFLNKNGTIIIKDVDDCFKIGYPDAHGYFEKSKQLSIADVYGGYRFSGRQIPHLLQKTGFKNIQFRKVGINSIGLDFDETDAFFDMCFGYLEEDYEAMLKENPNNKTIKEGLDWIKEHYEDLRDEFHQPGFFYMIGTVLLTAKR